MLTILASMPVLGIFIFAALLLILVGIVEALLEPPLKLKPKQILTKNETRFYNYLTLVSNGRYIVAVKPGLHDVLQPQSKLGSSLGSMWSKGHVDFLLVNPSNGESMLAIELDDRTHNTTKGHDRDKRKDKLFQAAQLPLLRTRTGHDWASEIETALNPAQALAKSDPKTATGPAASATHLTR